MVYFIGDIHVEIGKLKKLYSFILSKDSKPTLIFIGDYIDKGEDSKAVLAFLSSLKNDCIFLIGNHDFFWLNFYLKDINLQSYLINYGSKQ